MHARTHTQIQNPWPSRKLTSNVKSFSTTTLQLSLQTPRSFQPWQRGEWKALTSCTISLPQKSLPCFSLSFAAWPKVCLNNNNKRKAFGYVNRRVLHIPTNNAHKHVLHFLRIQRAKGLKVCVDSFFFLHPLMPLFVCPLSSFIFLFHPLLYLFSPIHPFSQILSGWHVLSSSSILRHNSLSTLWYVTLE